MTGVNLQQTFKYKYTLKQICHCEEQRDDAIWSVLTRLLHCVRNDRTIGGDCFAMLAMTGPLDEIASLRSQ